MDKETQISAVVSETTKELLERHVRATGVKKGHLVEQALRHHLQALQELPADVIVHPKLVLTRKSGEALLREIEKARPTDRRRRCLPRNARGRMTSGEPSRAPRRPLRRPLPGPC